MTTEAVLFTLRHVWDSLTSLKISAAVMGGIAVAAWKHVRTTRDVDLLVEVEDRDVSVLVNHLAQAGVKSKHADPLIRLDDAQFLQLQFQPPDKSVDVQIDLLLAQSEYQREALSRRIEIDAPELGFAFATLACEDLILHKLLAGRIIDLADAAVLLRINQNGLDTKYLEKWVEVHELHAEFEQIRKEAFPD